MTTLPHRPRAPRSSPFPVTGSVATLVSAMRPTFVVWNPAVAENLLTPSLLGKRALESVVFHAVDDRFSAMRLLLVGSGGVGDAFARIAARRDFFDRLIVADYDLGRAERTVATVRQRHPHERRFVAARVDA